MQEYFFFEFSVDKVKQVLDITEPLAKNVSAKSETQRVKLDDLTDRLQQMENRYAQLQGTAQSMGKLLSFIICFFY